MSRFRRPLLVPILLLGIAALAAALVPTARASAQAAQGDGTEVEFPWVPTYPTYTASTKAGTAVGAVCTVSLGGDWSDFDPLPRGGGYGQGFGTVPDTWGNPDPQYPYLRTVLRCNGFAPLGVTDAYVRFTLQTGPLGNGPAELAPFFASTSDAATYPWRIGVNDMLDPPFGAAQFVSGSLETTGPPTSSGVPVSFEVVAERTFIYDRKNNSATECGDHTTGITNRPYEGCSNELGVSTALASAIYDTTALVNSYVSTVTTWVPAVSFCVSDCEDENRYTFPMALSAVSDGPLPYPEEFADGGSRPERPEDVPAGVDYSGCSIPQVRLTVDGDTIYAGPPFTNETLAPVPYFEEGSVVRLLADVQGCSAGYISFGPEQRTTEIAPDPVDPTQADSAWVLLEYTVTEAGFFDGVVSGIAAGEPGPTLWVVSNGSETPFTTVAPEWTLEGLATCYDDLANGGWTDSLNPANWLRSVVCLVDQLLVPDISTDTHFLRMRSATLGRVPMSWIEELASAGIGFGRALSSGVSCSDSIFSSSDMVPDSGRSTGLCSGTVPTGVKSILSFGVWIAAGGAIWRSAPWRD